LGQLPHGLGCRRHTPAPTEARAEHPRTDVTPPNPTNFEEAWHGAVDAHTIRGSHGDCVRPALPRSQLSRAVAVSAAGGDAAAGAARLA